MRWAVVLLTVFTLSSLRMNAAAERESVDWIFVLDTSASMHGAGGAADIFGTVKDAIAQFIKNAREGDTVTLYTFDRDTTLKAHIRISGDLDKSDLLSTVDAQASEGDRTYTGKAIHDALARAIELKKRPDASNRTISIVLFTDGREDVSGINNPISIPSNIALIPKDQPYIFFISVGVTEHERQLESFVKAPEMGGRGKVIRDPGATRIAEVTEEIRTRVEPPRKVEPIQLTVTPTKLTFGQIEPGANASQAVRVTSSSDCRLLVRVDSSIQTMKIVQPDGPVSLKAGKEQTIEVTIQSPDDLNNGFQSFAIVIVAEPLDAKAAAATRAVEATAQIVRVPTWRKVLKYLLLLPLILIIALVIVSIVKGEPPWIWIPALVKPVSLQGELQIIQPRPARVEDEFITLTQLHARKVSLSSLIPNGASNGSDAELEVTKQKGKVGMKLQRLSGTVLVNGIEVASSKLYNEDLIELDASKVLFSWVNHDRPVDAREDQEF